MKFHTTLLPLLTLVIASCATSPKADIGFPEAMQQLSEGFAILRNNAPEKGRELGLAPTELIVNLELGTTAEGKVGVDLSAGGTFVKEITKLDISGSHSQTIERKNSIRLVFKNIYLDEKGKPYEPPTTGASSSPGKRPGPPVIFFN